MTELAARALPRIRIRRPKPRPPRWWWHLVWCVFEALYAVFCVLVGAFVTAAGCTLLCAQDWRTLVRWPEDSSLPSPRDGTDAGLVLGGVALIIAGVVV